jgi:hypothetical protein
MRRLRIFLESTMNIRSRTNWNGIGSLPRSGSMNLARPFKAGNKHSNFSVVASATVESKAHSSLTRRGLGVHLIPALKRRAKLIPTLRVENLAGCGVG